MNKKRNIRNDDSDSDNEDDSKVISVNNNIYFYCKVSRKTVLQLNTKLEEVQQSILNKKISEYEINLYIQSGGGELFAGISSMNYIENMTVQVNTIIDGFVASAASLIVLGGHTVYMQKHATLLIHQMTTGFYGKFEEFMDEVHNSKKSMKMITDIYKEKTKIPHIKLEKLMKKDIYLNANECKQYNIIDFTC